MKAERNYEFYNAELFVVFQNFCYWRHYLKKPHHTVHIVTNYGNLCALMTTHKLPQR